MFGNDTDYSAEAIVENLSDDSLFSFVRLDNNSVLVDSATSDNTARVDVVDIENGVAEINYDGEVVKTVSRNGQDYFEEVTETLSGIFK